MTHEFGSVVKDNSGWPRVVAEPFAVKEDGNVVASFVLSCDEFWPSGGFVDYGKCLYFLDRSFSWNGRRVVMYVPQTDEVDMYFLPR